MSPSIYWILLKRIILNYIGFLLLFRFWEGFGTNLGAFWGIKSY
jgi:hypothetical protein